MPARRKRCYRDAKIQMEEVSPIKLSQSGICATEDQRMFILVLSATDHNNLGARSCYSSPNVSHELCTEDYPFTGKG